MIKKMNVLNCTVILIIIFCGTAKPLQLYYGVGHIPQSCQVEWTNAGLLSSTPTTADNFVNINDYTGTDTERLQDAIEYAKTLTGVTIIYIPAGTYQITQTIDLGYNANPDLDGSIIIIQGAGANKTTLEFNFGGTNQNCFEILGAQSETDKVYLTSDLQKGATTVNGNFSGFTSPGTAQTPMGVRSRRVCISIRSVTAIM